jgi:hypothetical protein
MTYLSMPTPCGEDRSLVHVTNRKKNVSNGVATMRMDFIGRMKAINSKTI